MANNDMMARLGLKDEGFSKGVEEAKGQIGELGKEFGTGNKELVNFKKSMREARKDVMDLTATYAGLSDEVKKSSFGQAMAKEIDIAKNKLAELTDAQADLNEEIKHLASDTKFTDSVNAWTGVLGDCATAVVALGGDADGLQKTIMKLAKIQAVVKAVDSLTKAFQRQNLVLLKNPYAIAAMAVVALGTALYGLVSKADKATEELKKLEDETEDLKKETDEYIKTVKKGITVQEANRDIKKKVIADTEKEKTTIKILSDIVHDNARSYEDRQSALTQLQSIVPDYHASLTKEGQLIGDNVIAIKQYVTALTKAAEAQAKIAKIADLSIKQGDNDVEYLKKGGEYNKYKKLADDARKKEAQYRNKASNANGTTLGSVRGYPKESDGSAEYNKYIALAEQWGKKADEYEKRRDFAGKSQRAIKDANNEIGKSIARYTKDAEDLMSAANINTVIGGTTPKGTTPKGTTPKGTTPKGTTPKGTNATKNTSQDPVAMAEAEYANTILQIADKRSKSLYDANDETENEIGALQDNIKAMEKLLDTLYDADAGTGKYAKRIEEISDSLKKAKNTVASFGDSKIVKKAEANYFKTLELIGRERMENYITEEEATEKELAAKKRYIDELNQVENLSDDILSLIQITIGDINLEQDKKDKIEIDQLLKSFEHSLYKIDTQDNIQKPFRANDKFVREKGSADELYRRREKEGWIGDHTNYDFDYRPYHEIETDADEKLIPIESLRKKNDKLGNLRQKLAEYMDAYQANQEMANSLVNNEVYNKMPKSQQDNIKIGIEDQQRELEEMINSLVAQRDIELEFSIKMDNIDYAVGGINQMVQGFQTLSNFGNMWLNISDQWEDAANAFERFNIILQTVTQTLALFQSVMGIINLVNEVFNTNLLKNTVATEANNIAKGEEIAMETAHIPVMTGEAVAATALEKSILGLAAANIFLAHASIPFVGVPTATAMAETMMASMAAIKAQSLALANGGMVPGSSFHGDKVAAFLNSNEMVLNTHQQSNLFHLLDSPRIGGVNGNVKFEIEGTKLKGVLKNTDNKLSKIR